MLTLDTKRLVETIKMVNKNIIFIFIFILFSFPLIIRSNRVITFYDYYSIILFIIIDYFFLEKKKMKESQTQQENIDYFKG